MEQELIKIFDNLCEQNKKYISQNGTMSPMAFFIDKNNHLEIVLMVIRNPIEKELFKRLIKAKALMSEIKGYIIIMDSVMTSLNNDIAKTQEAVVTQLFTARKTLSKFLLHKGKEILKEEIPEGFKMKTDWNIWGEGMNRNIKEEKEIIEWYHQYKQDNPDKYKDVA